MKLEPNEAAVLIVHRTDANPPRYFVAVRKAGGSFNTASHDFQLDSAQQSILELGYEQDLPVAVEKAIAAIREIEA